MHCSERESLEGTRWHPEVPGHLSLLIKPPPSRHPTCLVPKCHLAARSWALPPLYRIQTGPVHSQPLEVYWHLSLASTSQSREAAWQPRRTCISVASHPAADMKDYCSSVTLWHTLLRSALMTVTSLYLEQGEGRERVPLKPTLHASSSF